MFHLNNNDDNMSHIFEGGEGEELKRKERKSTSALE